jgi:hypothetical protein
MSNNNEKLLIYFEDEEHIVRRLGAAVVSCWADLSKVARKKLLARASMVFDDQESDQLEQQIATFIAAHAASLRASRNKGHLDRKALHVTE